jgi:hypothetical protein
MFLKEIIVVHIENQTRLINTLCGRNGDFFNTKAGGTYSAQCISEELNRRIIQNTAS